jgi:hypothetical protein
MSGKLYDGHGRAKMQGQMYNTLYITAPYRNLINLDPVLIIILSC